MNAIQQWLWDQDPATVVTLVVLVWFAFAVFVVRAFQVCEAQQRKRRDAEQQRLREVYYIESVYNSPRLSPQQLRELENAKWDD